MQACRDAVVRVLHAGIPAHRDRRLASSTLTALPWVTMLPIAYLSARIGRRVPGLQGPGFRRCCGAPDVPCRSSCSSLAHCRPQAQAAAAVLRRRLRALREHAAIFNDDHVLERAQGVAHSLSRILSTLRRYGASVVTGTRAAPRFERVAMASGPKAENSGVTTPPFFSALSTETVNADKRPVRKVCGRRCQSCSLAAPGRTHRCGVSARHTRVR